MTGIDHSLCNLCISLLAGADPSGALGAVVGARVPDIDKKVGIEHRTWTHWPPVYMGILPVLFIAHLPIYGLPLPWGHTLVANLPSFFRWLVVGALLHVVEDSITRQGVPIVSPRGPFAKKGVGLVEAVRTRKRFSFGWTETGGLLERIIVLVLLIATILILSYRLGYLLPWLRHIGVLHESV